MKYQKILFRLEHIGIPGKDIKKTVEFYEKLGFETFYEATMNGTQHFAFLKLGDL
jgi:catechol 2,3-dioxygenase-like lactoylglutathione lyase family enzyme